MVKLAVRTAVASVLLLGGCAAPVGFQNMQQRDAAMSMFQGGQAQLSCMTAQCLGAWNATRPVVAQLASAGNWNDVAADVLAANFDQDLGWYYLGSAASAVGNRSAARIYFERSIQNSMAGGPQSCIPTACDGWNLPMEARMAMASLTPPAPTRVVRRRVAARRATPASASSSSSWVSPAGSASGGSSWVSPVTGGAASATSGGAGWVAPVASHQ